MTWAVDRVPKLLGDLARYGDYTYLGAASERALGLAFDVNPQTVNYWKKARREPPMFREFLQAYAKKHDLDEIALLHRWEIRPITRQAGQLDDLARRLANAPELQEIRQGSPEFFAQQWTPAAQEILSRARTEMDAVLAQAEADFLRLRLAVVKAWADERRKS